jgi:hypothetical protein
MITETTHVGNMRGPWLQEVAEESEALLREGVRLHGVCLYPILGMPEWHSPTDWTPMGMWDPLSHAEPHGRRVPHQPMLDAFRKAQHLNVLHARRLKHRERAFPPVPAHGRLSQTTLSHLR